ncbi:MAG: FAD-dependent monooxygenase [Bacteroidota bacterium]
MNIDIIGAGIGGLTTAIALQKKGIRAKILEQANEIKPVGAGIILANNAMQVYDHLGLRKEIEDGGNLVSSMNITDASLSRISSIDLTYFEKKHGVKNVAIHRGELQKILVQQLDKSKVELGKELIKVEKLDSAYQLKFSDGSSTTSAVLLGADGLNSKVREYLFSETKIRSAYQMCWRGVTNFTLPKNYRNELNEAWGKGDRVGFVQISPEKVYWYALKTFRQDQDEYSVDDLAMLFQNYHLIVKEIIQNTPVGAIHTATISDLQPIKRWYQDNVCLIGDAAHATTPNMGQGACQAIEDAYVLSECLAKYGLDHPARAFSEYQRLRMPKAHQVVNTSWTLGKVAHWKNSLAIQLRNQLMKMAPPSTNRKQSEKIFQLASV